MTGIKTDIVYSCHKPIICPDCIGRLRRENVSEDTISQCQAEIRRIQKALFYRITDFIKQYPLWALAISSATAIILGAFGSVLGSYIYEAIKQ
jgi:hypothetical protein